MSVEHIEFGEELCAVYDETVESAKQLAQQHTHVYYKITITPYDKENDDVPHGASVLCLSACAQLAEKKETAWTVMNIPAIKKWFHLSAKFVTVSVECRVQSLIGVDDLSVFHFVSEPTQLNDGKALSQDNDKNWSTTIHVRDSDPSAKSWPVELVWTNNRAQVLTSVRFLHDLDNHPRLLENMFREATLVKMHELGCLAPIAQKSAAAKRRRIESAPVII